MSTGANAAVRAPVATARRHRLRRGRTRILALSDLTMLAVAYTVSYLIADRIAPLPPVSGDAWFLAVVAVTAPFVWLAVFTANNLYDTDSLKISVSSFDETRDLFHAMLVGSLGYLLLSQGVDHFFGWWVYTPAEAFMFLGIALVLIPVARGSIRSWVFPRVMTPRRTLIVGTGAEALLVYRKITAHPEYGLEVVGFLNAEGEDDEGLPEPVIGSASAVAEIVDSYEVDRILIASSVGSHEETLDLLRTVHRPDVHVSIVPRYFEILTSYATLDDVEGMPVVTLPPIRLGRSSRALKRTVDVVVSASALLVLAPLFAVVAVAIKVDSKGTAL